LGGTGNITDEASPRAQTDCSKIQENTKTFSEESWSYENTRLYKKIGGSLKITETGKKQKKKQGSSQ